MIPVTVPGLGKVMVEEEDLSAFQARLNTHLAENRKPVEPVKPDTSIADQIGKDNKKLLEALVKELGKIKPAHKTAPPVVKVDAPVVKVEAPIVNVPEFPDITIEALEPIKKITMKVTSRDSKNLIDTVDLVVER